MAEEKPNCYKCKHRRTIPGDCHTRCAHPKVVEGNDSDNPFTLMAAMFSGDTVEATKELDIRGDANGIRNGWFMWPANFDPVWLQNCNGFES